MQFEIVNEWLCSCVWLVCSWEYVPEVDDDDDDEEEEVTCVHI